MAIWAYGRIRHSNTQTDETEIEPEIESGAEPDEPKSDPEPDSSSDLAGDQKRLLTTAVLHLSEDVAVGESRRRYLLLKNVREQKYLTVDRQQWKVLQRFRDGATAADVLPRLIVERDCPAFRNYYELLLKAIDTGILSDGPAGDTSVKVAPAKWEIRINAKVARFAGYGSILFGTGATALNPEILQLPTNLWEGIFGYLLISVALSLGYVLAACVVRGFDWQIYHPKLQWFALVPRFQIDLLDARMGGRRCEECVALMRLAPVFILSGVCAIRYQNLGFIALLGLFYVTHPFPRSAAVALLSALFRELRLSTSYDFFFVQNRMLWTILHSRAKFVDRKYLLIYGFYTLFWLLIVFQIACIIFGFTLTALYEGFLASGGLRISSLVMATLLGLLVAGTALTTAWIITRNLIRFISERRAGSREEAFGGVNALRSDPERVSEELSKILLLKETPEEVLMAITKAVKEVLMPPKKYVFRQGERGQTFYVVVSGQVEIVEESRSGRGKRIAVLSSGDAFGEIALLKNVPRTASVRTMRQTTLRSLSRRDFEKLILPHVGVENFTENLQKRAFLARIPLCRDWHPQALQRFAVDSALNTVNEGASVVREKQENHFFYIVYQGSFEVKRGKKSLAVLKPGDFFGEISLLQSSISNADVVAREDSKCISVHQRDFLKFIGTDFLIGMQVESISSKRLKHPVFPLDVRTHEAVE